jgi:hypothetical protein
MIHHEHQRRDLAEPRTMDGYATLELGDGLSAIGRRPTARKTMAHSHRRDQ